MIALIAAVARNGTIGKDGKIPWHLPADLKRFKALTMGHILVMGRKTYESIGKPLPGRRTIVLTRSRAWTPSTGDLRDIPRESEGNGTYLSTASSITEAIGQAMDAKARCREGSYEALAKAFICGGAEVYREALERNIVDRQYLTAIDADFEGDTFMPQMPFEPGPAKWAIASEEFHLDEKPPYRFLTLDRRR